MSAKVIYYDSLRCEVSEPMRRWYTEEAEARSLLSKKRVFITDIVREALQFYIDNRTSKT